MKWKRKTKMARVLTAKKSTAGKEIKCKKCSRVIAPGETYFHYTRRFSRVGQGVRYTHCSQHRPRPTDLSSSPMAEIYEAQEDAQKAISAATCGADLSAAIEDVRSVAEDVKTRAEESLDNMPENLRENSDSGQQLQERIDALDSYISELEGVSIDESLEMTEAEDDADEAALEEAETANQEFESAQQEAEAAIDSLSL